MLTVNKEFFLALVFLATRTVLAEETIKDSGFLRLKRMVGGTLAPQVPWQAMVYLSDSVLDGGYAGGALISDRWVLTAGRNLFIRKSRQDTQGKDPIIPKVYLGISQKAEANASKEVAVDKVFLHPDFQNQTDWDNDLALIKLKESVIMTEVTPIPLPERGQDLDTVVGGSGVIAGWGWGIHLTPATSLKYLVLPLANYSDCKAEYERSSHTPSLDDNMFCTRPTQLEENVCFGDAGGALAVRDAQSGDVYAAGILSYDKSCSRNSYGVYMKISSYLPWIHRVIRGDTEKSSALRSDAMAKMFG
ncbi:haptoglobin [Poecilia latipinna]|uniref:haptoglobin-like n=1 Tax=Poecilia mexicana TaxID=48701 RepID=UPI00072EA50E|nr:PREDICTED: haptoglobin-like [Poecilia mexicana]XP_014885717.1 PREDICTED: haptoglobin-like [Poecilia latipinna]